MQNNLDLEIVAIKLDEFAINYDLEIKEGYTTLIFNKLNEKGFTDADFVNSIDKIMETTTTTFNKMPNLAMFLEYSPKKTLTPQESCKIKTSEVMQFLATQSYKSVYGEEVWDYADYKKRFDDESINILIQAEFGGVRGLTDRYRQQKAAGYTELFRKELQAMFETQDLVSQQNRIAIENEKQEELGELVNDLSNKLKV
jgi:hypothetical protein